MKVAALLRGVNVGGHKSVAMSALRDLVSSMGFTGVRTLLQSGNLVFEARSRSAPALERALEAETVKHLGVRTSYFVRTADDLRSIVTGNPFADEALREPGKLVVVLLKEPCGASVERTLTSAIVGRERCRVAGRHLYVVYPDGQGRSKFTNAAIERLLGTSGTARNWNTILKLEAAVSSRPEAV